MDQPRECHPARCIVVPLTQPPASNPLRHLRLSDLRGMAQLATQATTGVASMAEGVHRSVLDTMRLPAGSEPGRTRGITGLVYRTVRGITKVVGHGIDKALAELETAFDTPEASRSGTPLREALIAALNGVIGDRLAAGNSTFAATMSLRCRDEFLDFAALPAMPGVTGKIAILIHGLCMSDLRTYAKSQGHEIEYGQVLAEALGYTPVYVRYNSGLHVSQNGRELAAQLEQLVDRWPVPVEDLTVVAHSMGGLLIRSAAHYASEARLRWPQSLRHVVFLGTPHHGAPLERAGNWVDVMLGSTPYSAPFARLGKLRSAGITDLRHGLLLDEDWHGHDRFHRRPDSRRSVALPAATSCYAVAATTAARRSRLADRLVGDGLVPLRSALGQHDDPARNLSLAPASQRIVYRVNHMELLGSHAVAQQITRWLAPGSAASPARRQDP